MEHFFQYDFHGDILLFDDAAFPVNQSAFVRYYDKPIEGFDTKNNVVAKNHMNINKRMTEFLKKSQRMAREVDESERERGLRHMISERMRREKQKQSFLGLHSLLPSGTKKDKNTIIVMAAKKVEELQRCKEELKRKRGEIEKVLYARKSEEEEEVEQAKIKISVAYPSSGVDSMLEVLKCLKQTNSKIRVIQSKLSSQQLSAVLGIETKVGAAEVENAVHRTLFEVEKKFRFNTHQAQEGGGYYTS